MPSCIIVGCRSRSGRDKVGFYGIPSVIYGQCDKTLELSARRRTLWVARVNRPNFGEENISRDTKVCSKHFLSGKPSALFDDSNVDWVPSINLGYESCSTTSAVVAYHQECYNHVKPQILKRKTKNILIEGQPKKMKKEVGPATASNDQLGESVSVFVEIVERDFVEGEKSALGIAKDGSVSAPVSSNSVACQTESISKDFEELQRRFMQVMEDNVALRARNNELNSCLEKCLVTEDSLRNDNEKVSFYTGLPTFQLLMQVFNLVSSVIPSSYRNTLPKFSEFMMVLMRLRLGLLEDDLAYRFGIAQPTVSGVLNKWINAMAGRLQEFIIWPERKNCHFNMPACFKNQFGDSFCVIVDCFELIIDKSPNYKQQNTVKFLIGITPRGTVSFISNGLTGHTSDQEIIRQSGIVDKLIPGDVVLAEQDIIISGDMDMYRANLQIPALITGNTQLSTKDSKIGVTADVKIHVEHVTGLLKRKFHILKGAIPFSLTKACAGDDLTLIDMIVRICCALVNLCHSPLINGGEDSNSVGISSV